MRLIHAWAKKGKLSLTPNSNVSTSVKTESHLNVVAPWDSTVQVPATWWCETQPSEGLHFTMSGLCKTMMCCYPLFLRWFLLRFWCSYFIRHEPQFCSFDGYILDLQKDSVSMVLDLLLNYSSELGVAAQHILHWLANTFFVDTIAMRSWSETEPQSSIASNGVARLETMQTADLCLVEDWLSGPSDINCRMNYLISTAACNLKTNLSKLSYVEIL